VSALGLLLLSFGLLTAWAGFDKVTVTDVLRSVIGAPTAPRTATGALQGP
jgi:hypothetical protein